jgi:hypothetical protein
VAQVGQHPVNVRLKRPHRFSQQPGVERHGGPALLADMHDHLTGVLAARPDAIGLPGTAGAVEQTYQALTAILRPAS